jgi:hypothetical protein
VSQDAVWQCGRFELSCKALGTVPTGKKPEADARNIGPEFCSSPFLNNKCFTQETMDIGTHGKTVSETGRSSKR